MRYRVEVEVELEHDKADFSMALADRVFSMLDNQRVINEEGTAVMRVVYVRVEEVTE